MNLYFHLASLRSRKEFTQKVSKFSQAAFWKKFTRIFGFGLSLLFLAFLASGILEKPVMVAAQGSYTATCAPGINSNECGRYCDLGSGICSTHGDSSLYIAKLVCEGRVAQCNKGMELYEEGGAPSYSAKDAACNKTVQLDVVRSGQLIDFVSYYTGPCSPPPPTQPSESMLCGVRGIPDNPSLTSCPSNQVLAVIQRNDNGTFRYSTSCRPVSSGYEKVDECSERPVQTQTRLDSLCGVEGIPDNNVRSCADGQILQVIQRWEGNTPKYSATCVRVSQGYRKIDDCRQEPTSTPPTTPGDNRISRCGKTGVLAPGYPTPPTVCANSNHYLAVYLDQSNYLTWACAAIPTGNVRTADGCGYTPASTPPPPSSCRPDGVTCNVTTIPNCGLAYGKDNCGNTCTKDFGRCTPPPSSCNPDGVTCNLTSIPNCGLAYGRDNCGNPCTRDFGSCSSILPPLFPPLVPPMSQSQPIDIENINNNTNINNNSNSSSSSSSSSASGGSVVVNIQ